MQPKHWNIDKLWSRLKATFPEHQIYLRTNGKVRFLTLNSGMQIALCCGAFVALVWLALTSWTYFNEDDLLAAKQNEIGEIQQRYSALETDLNSLETDLSAKAKELEERQNLLHTVVQQGLVDGLIRLEDLSSDEVDDGSTTPAAKPAPPLGEDKKAEADMPADAASGGVADIYRVRYTQIAQRQDKFAKKLIRVAEREADLVESTLENLNLSTDKLLKNGKTLAMNGAAKNVGGPYVPASLTETDLSILDIGGAEDAESLLDQLTDEWKQLLYIREAMKSVPALIPVDNYFVSSSFGNRRDPFTGRRAMHSGLDLAAWYGSKVKSATDGVVTRAGYMSGYGRMVEIDHGNGFRTRYGHLRKVLTKKGAKVKMGDIVGESGNTGRSTGPHLHYEVWFNGKPVDPKPYLEASNHVLQIQRRNHDDTPGKSAD